MTLTTLMLDLDGTVWDGWAFYSRLLSEAANRPAAEYVDRLRRGDNLPELVAEIDGFDDESLERACRSRGSELQVYSGMVDVLADAKTDGIVCAVVTDLVPWVCLPLLDVTGLVRFFDVVLHQHNSVSTKPDPAIVRDALARTGATSSQALYVGDRRGDALAAQGAGVLFAWAAYGYEEPDESLADYIIDAPADIGNILKTQGRASGGSSLGGDHG